jgi:hypothetical protein
MSNTLRTTLPAGTTTVLAAPRQFWLATLGAANVTREWAGKEAGTVFRALINEGTVVETRAIRLVARRIETSVARANALVRDARTGVRASVESIATIAARLRERLPVVHARLAVDTPPVRPARATKTSSTRKARKPARSIRARTKR